MSLTEPVAETSTWTARAFAFDPDDLAHAIDPATPAVATDTLLCACLRDRAGRPPGIDEVRRWTVAQRLDGLLAMRQAGGTTSEQIATKCLSPDCGERFEAELELAACRQSGFDLVTEFETRGRQTRARIPTGEDQARWQRERTSLAVAAAELLEADAAASDPDDATIAALSAALARVDPLRDLPLDLVCPECGATNRYVLDLESHLLQVFARMQRRWLREIAMLASVYHWAEAEIAAMPDWRRAFYLGTIAARAPCAV
jgi:rubredoxin